MVDELEEAPRLTSIHDLVDELLAEVGVISRGAVNKQSADIDDRDGGGGAGVAGSWHRVRGEGSDERMGDRSHGEDDQSRSDDERIVGNVSF